MERDKGWFVRAKASRKAYYWDGSDWSLPRQRSKLSAGTDYTVDAYAGFGPNAFKLIPDKRTLRRFLRWFIPFFGVFLIVCGIAGYLSGEAKDANRPSKNPTLTESNAAGYCKELISSRLGGEPQWGPVRSAVFDPEGSPGSFTHDPAYKTVIQASKDSTTTRWTCRVLWAGGRWNPDVLDSRTLPSQ